MREFNQIIKDRAASIKKAILDPLKVESIQNEPIDKPKNADLD